jgi:hypothetical protein
VAIARYLLGACPGTLVLGLLVVASFRWCRRLLPRWSGAPVALATTVVVLTVVICTEEALGGFGVLSPVSVLVVLAVLGGSGLAAARFPWHRTARNDETDEPFQPDDGGSGPTPGPLWVRLVALGSVSLVVADWATRTIDAVHHGMSTPDTLWYHMPFAARFVQQGTISPLHFVDTGVDLGSVIPFYPANGELVHTLGILALGNDFLSPLLNLGWLAIALLAAWCLGRPYGAAPVTVTGAAALMAAPGLVATQPGGAYTDVVGLALLLSAAAVLVNGEGRREAAITTAIAALATGLALGTKFTFVAPVVLLTIGVWVVTPRTIRVRTGLAWLTLVAITGGFFYVRNVVVLGNPLPSAVHLGPLHLSAPPQPTSTTVANFLFKAGDWRHWYLPGLRASIGPAWWAVLALAGAGLIVAIAGPTSPVRRMLAFVGVGSIIAFVFTPQLLTLPPYYAHVPYNFVFNLRYSFAGLLFGLTLLPTVTPARPTHFRHILIGAYALIVVVTQFDSTIWPVDLLSTRFGPAIAGVDDWLGLAVGITVLAVGLGLMVLAKRRPSDRRPARRVVVVATVSLIVIGASLGAEQFYLRHRYQSGTPLATLYAWAQGISNTRMAITGPFSNITYPLYGQNDSNYVQVLGQPGGDASFTPLTTCRAFRSALDAGRYADVVVVQPGSGHGEPTQSGPARWTASDPSSHRIFHRSIPDFDLQVSVFRIRRPLDVNGCRTA